MSDEEEVTPSADPEFKDMNKQFYNSSARVRKGGKVDFIIPVYDQKVVFAVRVLDVKRGEVTLDLESAYVEVEAAPIRINLVPEA
mgnify:CR=1 FL=1